MQCSVCLHCALLGTGVLAAHYDGPKGPGNKPGTPTIPTTRYAGERAFEHIFVHNSPRLIN